MPAPTHSIVTANYTDDGGVAWRRADGTWSRQIAEAGLLDAPAATAAAASAKVSEQREISDPYVIEVHADGATIAPLTARERIRANGPTIRLRRPDPGAGH